MKNGVICNINLKDILGAIASSVLLSLFFIVMINAFELIIPYTFYWKYLGDTPVMMKRYYEVGESIDILSYVDNREHINKQWQDRAYCITKDLKATYKLPTQYRPESGYEHTIVAKDSRVWDYKEPIPLKMSQCVICGVIVGVTERGYKKYDSYCTKWFGVNGNKNIIKDDAIIIGAQKDLLNNK